MSKNIPVEIPHYRPLPILGHLLRLDKFTPVQSITKMASDFDGIFRLILPNHSLVVVSSQKLVHELCNEQVFDKKLHKPLEKLRPIAKDGLFTANTHEANWGKAHRILMTAFGPSSLRQMYPGMLDIAEQMLLKWERLGDGTTVDVADNMTRLTLDTIALTGFGFRFNSFYDRQIHPFIEAMIRTLQESGKRSRRPHFATNLMLKTQKQFDEDARYLHQVSDQLVAERKRDPQGQNKKDLLSAMLYSADPVTGEKLDDENIRYQMVTFLVAGHETTSGLLSFAIYALLKNPEIMKKAQAEIDRILQGRTPQFEDIAKLTYIDQILKETLRLWPTAPAFAVHTDREDLLLGGRYPLRKNETILIMTSALHRDPKVWENAEVFDPERMSAENFKKLPPDSWKPFGNGQRGCIGRGFAMQEAILVLTMLLQRFDLEFSDPRYELKIKETLTLKPDGLFVRFKKRERQPIVVAPPSATKSAVTVATENSSTLKTRRPLRILFGSNMGSSEAFARRIGEEAERNGYVTKIGSLDSAVNDLSPQEYLIVVTASYEGQPPDNAKKFVAWMQSWSPSQFQGLQYAVFGCGNRDWASTYQAIPTLIDHGLQKAGAQALLSRGEADARADFFGDFEKWYKKFAALIHSDDAPQENSDSLSLEFITSPQNEILQSHQMAWGTVLENRELVNRSAEHTRSKRHLKIQLPAGAQYRAGDYLTILPSNPQASIDRVLRQFQLKASSQVVLHSKQKSASLPLEKALQLQDILGHYIEISQPATQSQIEEMAAATPCPPEKRELLALIASENIFIQEVLAKRISVLDLLERYQSCGLSFARYLHLMPPLKPRRYSISSSPLENQNHCTLTVSITEGPAWSGAGHFQGVTSAYISRLKAGDLVAVMPKASHENFSLPADSQVPLIFTCAGSGIAPFRGFLQERALQKAQGQQLGEVLLFFGCHHQDIDYLYKEELENWQRQGVVQLRPAFSDKAPEDKKYVQHRLWQDRQEVASFLQRGAKLYVCGEGRNMAPAVKETFQHIYQEAYHSSQEEAAAWMSELEKSGYYVVDVFA